MKNNNRVLLSLLLAALLAQSSFISTLASPYGHGVIAAASVRPVQGRTSKRTLGAASFASRRALPRSKNDVPWTNTANGRGKGTQAGLGFLMDDASKEVRMCSSVSVGKTLLKGALLRIASDLSGGTQLENIKTRVTVSTEGWIEATKNIVKTEGFMALWSGTQPRTIEGALIGAVFMLGSRWTRSRVLTMGASPTIASLAGGLVGGVAQAFIMTPAGVVFTSLHCNHGKPGYEHENALTVTKRIMDEKGFLGMFIGFKPMAYRQATNWASRAGFTEIARSAFGLNQYGLLGEFASGAIGGIGSCWNTPIETIRVIMHRDISSGKEAKKLKEYWDDIVKKHGYPGLFRGVTPRGIQAIWQTCFLVVVPNLMGI